MATDDMSPEKANLAVGLLRIGGSHIAIDLTWISEIAHVSELRPALKQHEGALGTISVRGTFVPVVDALNLISACSTAPEIAVLISNGERTMGLAADAVLGIHQVATDKIQGNASHGDILPNATEIDGVLTEILDPEALLDQPHLPSIASNIRSTREKARGSAEPYLTFEASSVHYAVNLDSVFGTIPKQGPEDATMADGAFLGFVSYLGRRLPVMAASRVFGLGGDGQMERFETVILRFSDDRILGLAVEKICNVVQSVEMRVSDLSANLKTSMAYIRATAQIEGGELFLVDETTLREAPGLIDIAGMSDKPTKKSDIHMASGSSGGSVVQERERYILLYAGGEFAIRMTDVDGMSKPPDAEKVVPVQSNLPGMMGLFFHDGELLPLVHLSEYIGSPSEPDPTRARLILTKSDKNRCGYLVDKVEGIGTSLWYEKRAETSPSRFDMVGLRLQGKKLVRNAIDLRAMTSSLEHGQAFDLLPEPSPTPEPQAHTELS